MKILPLTLLICLSAAGLCACAGSQPESETVPETTAAETTTVTTAAETTTEETTTTTTTVPYLLADNAVLAYSPASARPTGVVMTLTNNGEEALSYGGWNVYDAAGNAIPNADSEYEPDTAKHTVQAGETAEITYDWTARYGDLPEGEYLMEQILDDGISEDPETGETVQGLPTVCRAPFVINGADYAPLLSIDPSTVRASGVTLHVANAPDQGRDYTMVYRVYDSSDTQVMRQSDTEAQLRQTYHFDAGEIRDMKISWLKVFGNLEDGDYELELAFIGADDKVTSTYRVPFTVRENQG